MRKIYIYKYYFLDFYDRQTADVQKKIEWVLGIIRDLKIIPEKYFKHIEGKIYEVRIQSGNNIYRIFSFFDEGNVVVIGNAFQKKTQKIPRKEIELAKRIMEEYFNEKE